MPEDDLKSLGLEKTCTNIQYLEALVRRGLQAKIDSGIISKDKYNEYWARAEMEMGEINRLYFTEYILLVYHIIKFCIDNQILNGYGRGSAAGSLCLYLLKVTNVDPIRFDLLFERFISSARTDIKDINGQTYISSESLPDVDLDSDRNLKYKINDYLNTICPNRTAAIANFGTLQGKIAIKEVLKSYLGYGESESKAISSLIQSAFGKVDSIKKSLEDNVEFKKWVEKDVQNQECVDVACKLSGLFKNFSVHASGVLLCENPLEDTIPIQLSSDKKLVSSMDMSTAQLVAIKIDNLGLKNLSAIKECLTLVGKTMDDINLDDPSIYQFFNLRNEFYGIFQAEEGLGKDILKKIQPKCMEDVSDSIAIGRPGAMNYLENYLSFKGGDDSALYGYPQDIKDILSKTGGIIIYQEQLMKLSRVMAKFSPQESDKIRKVVGKKLVKEMPKWKDKFINQSVENGYSREVVDKVWKSFDASANYSFNRSHSVSYCALTCCTAYLKQNHPKEFFLSLLKNSKHESDPIGEIATIHKELPAFGIELLPPDLIKSEMDFSIDGPNIRFGLSSIKGIAEKAMNKLGDFRNQYSTKFEVFHGAEEAGLNVGILAALIQAGAMHSFNESRSKTVLEAQLWRVLTERERKLAMNLGPEFKYSLLTIVKAMTERNGENGKPLIKASRFDTIKKKYDPYKQIYLQNSKSEKFANWFYERSLLGYSYSARLADIFQEKNENIQNIPEVINCPEKEHVLFVGIVKEVVNAVAKNAKKTKYMKLAVEDESAMIDVLIFNESIAECQAVNNGELPKEDDIVVIEGFKKPDAVFANLIKVQPNKIYTKLAQVKIVDKDKKDS